MIAIIQGHLTHSLDEKRYLLDGEAAFAQLATLIRQNIPAEAGPDGLDFGQVRITIQVLEDGTEDDEE